MTRAALAIATVLTGGVARAGDDAHDGQIRVDVELARSVERDVASAAGWFCDDPTLVHAELVTRDDHNVWIVTGAKLGRTSCRVGTDPYRIHYVFDVHVVAAKPPAKRT